MGVQLPRWVWVGAFVLSCIGGMVNVAGYLGFEHQAITHLTGTTTLLGDALSEAAFDKALHLGGVIVAFVLGAMLSGLIIQDSTLRLGRRYGVALTGVSLLLFASIPMLERQWILGAWTAAMACGLQNAMATTYSGAVIRTTHLSGMFTDLGIGLGHALRGLPLQTRRLRLSALIIAGFLSGAVLGAWLFRALAYRALAVPAVLTGVVGLAYTVHRHWKRHEVS
ncbi:MAG: DUF1275 domain-containing protein [Xanthomonadaceae bacterium]|nr:DUF1275 domain-containing protein [Xanthomonadaceae bacterium]